MEWWVMCRVLRPTACVCVLVLRGLLPRVYARGESSIVNVPCCRSVSFHSVSFHSVSGEYSTVELSYTSHSLPLQPPGSSQHIDDYHYTAFTGTLQRSAVSLALVKSSKGLQAVHWEWKDGAERGHIGSGAEQRERRRGGDDGTVTFVDVLAAEEEGREEV